MSQLSDFLLTKKLGAGAYGEVFLAKRRVRFCHASTLTVFSAQTSSKLLAIKCILRKKLTKKAEDNLVGEISILKDLRHPHIVRMCDFDVRRFLLKHLFFQYDSSRVYIFMEYCAGGDFATFLRVKHRLSEDLVQYFLRQMGIFRY